ncbi:MAG: PhnE/PtxC family ABC transporter permease [Planctomycetota bacterium]
MTALRANPISARGGVAAAILVTGLVSAWWLGLAPSGLIPGEEGLRVAGRFVAAAASPALDYQDPAVPAEAPALLAKVLEAMRKTLVFAAAAMSLAVPAGVLLGFLGASAWWRDDPRRATSIKAIGPIITWATRLLMTFLRSIHELIWALLFLVALGITDVGAVLAIALPYAGTLGKVFSEMIDEAPRDAAEALRAAGAAPAQVFMFGLATRAAPDMASYSFYRFECALRSSAVLGFFGYPTLGLSIKLSFENAYYNEVWTYLYALLLMVALLEIWSGSLRRRFVA